MHYKFLMLIVLVLVGCGANPPPTSVPLPLRSPIPVSATTTVARTNSPPVSPLTNDDLLRMFPLKQGAQWVYLENAYFTAPINETSTVGQPLFATLQITDTVVATELRDPYYAAKVVRETTILTATRPLDPEGEYAKSLFIVDEPDTKWLIFNGDRIYWSFEPLDWNVPEQFYLGYQFPLADGACWHPAPDLPKECAAGDPPQWRLGSRVVQPLESQHVPAGDFDECILVSEIYNSGPTMQRICRGVGIVGEDFDHSGTPFGSHSQLIKFTAGQ